MDPWLNSWEYSNGEWYTSSYGIRTHVASLYSRKSCWHDIVRQYFLFALQFLLVIALQKVFVHFGYQLFE